MKQELLAPAGNMECLESAIHNGADAVYLAGKLFGARKFAANFSNDELIEAVDYAHIYGVKVYVTVNTIIYEDEMQDCLNYCTFLYNIGVDAVIVQDLGLIVTLKKYLPDLEIHASTQAHTHNIEQIRFLESLGVKRVVLAREMSISEINELDTDMEIEAFIHGALCISYSGQCLLSSGILGRSGNRGECAGLCRIPYNLIKDNKTVLKNKYLLSPKEFNSTSYIELLKKSKVFSFKIEGRMKSPEYVGYVTSIYRKLLDNDDYKLTSKEIYNLKCLYNRGFTKGFLFSNTDDEFISLNSSNHQGVKVGEVILVMHDKIKIHLTEDLSQGDAVRLPNGEGMYVNFLYDEKMKLINHASKEDIVYLDNKVKLSITGDVMLTINSKLIQEINSRPLKKIMVNCKVVAHINEPIEVSYTDLNHIVTFKGDVVTQAKNSPISKSRITEIMGKLGNTPFVLNNIDLEVDDNIFMAVGVLNEIRRTLIQELVEKRKGVKHNVKLNVNSDNLCRDKCKPIITALARTEEQVKELIDLNVDTIYVTNKDLYNKYKDETILRLDRVINKHEDYDNEKLLIGETGSLMYAKNNQVFADYYLNVVNHQMINLLKNYGVRRVCLSPELSIERINELVKHVSNSIEVEVIVYGRIEYMIMKYNMKKNMNLDNSQYALEDKSGRILPIISDNYTHLMSHEPINKIDNVLELINSGVNAFRLELFLENKMEVRDLVTKLQNLVK